MDQHHDQSPRLGEITEYLRANPTPSGSTGTGPAQHVHIHHHYAPPAPPPPPPKATVAEQVVPWVMLGLGACIILTICGLFLAVALVALVLGLLAMAVLVAVIAYLIKTINESRAQAARPNRRTK